jgi:hypothetical protein
VNTLKRTKHWFGQFPPSLLAVLKTPEGALAAKKFSHGFTKEPIMHAAKLWPLQFRVSH